MKPESAELIAEAVFEGVLMIPGSIYAEQQRSYSDIEHYFDANRDEIGLIVFPGTIYEWVQRFEPPRKWSEQFLNRLIWVTLTK